MKKAILDSELTMKFGSASRFSLCHFRNLRYGSLRSEFWIFLIFSYLLLFSIASNSIAQVTHLQVLDAEGKRIRSLELLEHNSVKYVLENEVKELFSGTKSYQPIIKRVTITIMHKRIVFTLNKHQVKVDNDEYVLSAPPISISGKIAIPVELLTEIMPVVIDRQITLDQKNWVLQIKDESFIKNGETIPDQPIPTIFDADFRVIIDPGHGGSDTGSKTKVGLQEKTQVLKIAQQIKDLLEVERGIDVYLTRSSDRFMTTAERINLANKLRGHIYLSLHFNWSPCQYTNGFRIYVNSNQVRLGKGLDSQAGIFSDEKSTEAESSETKQFFIYSKHLANEIARQLKNLGLSGEQDKEVFLADMDNLSMPGVLVEVLYFSNAKDLKVLSSSDFINSVSRVFCDSILVLRDTLREKSTL